MAVQESVAVRNAVANVRETTIGTSPVLRIFTGNQPANCATANSGTELVAMTLPSDWMAAASGGAAAKAGTWSGTAGADGTAGHYRIYASDGTTCHRQGDIPDDLVLDTTAILTGRVITIVTAVFTEGNA